MAWPCHLCRPWALIHSSRDTQLSNSCGPTMALSRSVLTKHIRCWWGTVLSRWCPTAHRLWCALVLRCRLIRSCVRQYRSLQILFDDRIMVKKTRNFPVWDHRLLLGTCRRFLRFCLTITCKWPRILTKCFPVIVNQARGMVGLKSIRPGLTHPTQHRKALRFLGKNYISIWSYITRNLNVIRTNLFLTKENDLVKWLNFSFGPIKPRKSETDNLQWKRGGLSIFSRGRGLLIKMWLLKLNHGMYF